MQYSIRFLSLFTVVWVFMFLPTTASAEQVFRAGAYAMDVTPLKFPVPMNGSMAPRYATQAHDPLHARCIVLDDGATKIAIVITDFCLVPREIFDSAKTQAQKLTGIRPDHMLMSATHTHTGVSVTPAFQTPPADDEYLQYLAQKIAEGVKRAHDQLEPAQIGWAVGYEPNHVFNRRWMMRAAAQYENPFGVMTDRARMNPGNNNKDVERPIGPVDPEVPVLALRAKNGQRPIAVLANYSLHYVGGIPGDSLSADYYGVFAQRLAELIGATDTDPPFMAAMSNGTSGDINNIDFGASTRQRREPFEQCRIVGNDLAIAAYKAFQTIQYRDHVTLRARETTIDLGVRRPTAEEVEQAKATIAAAKSPPPYRDRAEVYALETLDLAKYPPTVNAKLQAIRIGELGIAAIPCEVFVEIGLEIKRKSPLPTTFTIELANGYNGYLPTPQQHELGGYETWRAKSSYLETQASVKITRTILDLLNQVAQ